MNDRYKIQLFPYNLEFAFRVMTSRGVMPDHSVIFLGIEDLKSGFVAFGEINVLPGLSEDASVDYLEFTQKIYDWIENIDLEGSIEDILFELDSRVPKEYPALRMGMESAILELKSRQRGMIFNNERRPVIINGLVWMGNSEIVLRQITEKIRDGFSCIKIKVGGLHFEDELDILEYVRRKYYKDNIIIRLDANGSFSGKNPLDKLEILSKYNIHSIEQPVKPDDPELSQVIKDSPIPVALDESLIGVHGEKEKIQLLESLRPGYLVLKPSLHGGFYSCKEWIKLAESKGINWWVTSALETNIGLNAIADFVCGYDIKIHQGLGTGKIYDNNIPSPLAISGEELILDSNEKWDINFDNNG